MFINGETKNRKIRDTSRTQFYVVKGYRFRSERGSIVLHETVVVIPPTLARGDANLADHCNRGRPYGALDDKTEKRRGHACAPSRVYDDEERKKREENGTRTDAYQPARGRPDFEGEATVSRRP